jgi:hypothetical protein
MSVLEALGQWAENNGAGTLGVDLFVSRLPDKPDVAIALHEYSGGPPVEMFGPQGISLHRVRIQVTGRGARDDYPTVRDNVLDLYESMATITNIVQSSYRILRVKPLGYPGLIGYDDKNRFRIVFNTEVLVEPGPVVVGTGFGLGAFGTSPFGS